MNRFLLAAGLVLGGSSLVRGDPPPGVKAIRVVLHPSADPSPALKYPLLPHLAELKPGNALPHYRSAINAVKEALNNQDDPQWYESVDRWIQMPLDRLPQERVRRFLEPLEPGLHLAEEAARYEFVDWELTEKLRKQGIGTLLPETQEVRNFAIMLSLRARLAMAEGRLKDAHRDLQTMLAVARHTGQTPVLIGSLVGIVVASRSADQIEQWIQQPKAPNLYWSLTDLPRPFINLRLALQGERVAAYGTFPNLPLSRNDADKIMTPEQVQMAVKLASGLRFGFVEVPEVVFQARFGLQLMDQYENSKKILVEEGWPRDAVDKMPHVQVGLLRGMLDYERQLDEATKWSSMPYWQATPALLKMEKNSRSYRSIFPLPDEPAFSISQLLLPRVGYVVFARTGIERRFAALRCLEALRIYAAGHEGKLPLSLAEIKEVPIPADPFTGEPFEYHATGDKATLYGLAVARPFPGEKANPQNALFYEIVMKR